MTQPATQPSGYLLRGDRDRYDRIDAVNFSTLKELQRSPAHYRHRREHPTMQTPAMALGAALHMAVLEPDTFALRYASFDGDRRTKAGKEEWAAFLAEGKLGLRADEYAECLALSDAVNSNATARKYLDSIEVEVGAVWTDSATGVLCKGRLDAVGPMGIPDLKTTKDASPRRFCSDAWGRCYHWQGAIYVDGYAAATGTVLPYVIIAVEKEPPYIVQVYTMPESVLDIGRAEYTAALERVRSCRAFDRWPGYAEAELDFAPPQWAGTGTNDDVPTVGGKPMY